MSDDEIPEYDLDDPDGDRQAFLDDPEHANHEELFPDKEPDKEPDE